MHEIGHVLGLGHIEDNPDSIMQAEYPKAYNRTRADYLPVSDQILIQKIYGKRVQSLY